MHTNTRSDIFFNIISLYKDVYPKMPCGIYVIIKSLGSPHILNRPTLPYLLQSISVVYINNKERMHTNTRSDSY